MFEGLFQSGRNTGSPIKRRGIGRVLEIIMDNTTRFLVSSLIALLCAVPGAAAVLYALGAGSGLLLIAAGLAGGMLFGPAYAALSDGMLYAMRGLPGNWWRKYRHAWAVNWKDSLLPGALTGLLAALLVYEGAVIVAEPSFLPTSIYVCTGITAAIALAVFTYFWPQRVFSDLKNRQIFHNCFLMLLAHPTKSLKAMGIQLLYWFLLVVGFPYSAIALPILGLWFPMLLAMLIIYNQLNEDFKIEERLEEEGLV